MITSTNNADSVTQVDLTASTSNEQIAIFAPNAGNSRGSAPTNGDTVILLPSAATAPGQKIGVTVHPRSTGTTAKNYFQLQSGEKINGAAASLNESYLDAGSSNGTSVSLVSDGVSWMVESHS